MSFVEDLPAFLVDFGIDVLLNGNKVRCIFDTPFAESFGIVSGNSPAIVISLSTGIVKGAVVSIPEAGEFVVSSIEPDGMGMCLARLQEADQQ